jgi:MoaA/NifB/PqqE/SkfB family radical SAM enzyme
MCDIGQKKRDSMFYKQSLREGINISIDLLDKLVDEVGAYFPKIDFAGVEPLLHPEIIQLMERVKRQRLFLSLTTNGLLLEHYAENLVQTGLDAITVSIDGPGRIHDVVRGVPGAFQKVITGLTKLKNLRKNFKTTKPHITVNYCITDMNVGTLAETASIIFAEGLTDTVAFTHPFFVTESASNEHNRLFGDIGLSTPAGPQASILTRVDIDVLWDQLCKVKASFPQNRVKVTQGFHDKTKLFDYYHRPEVSIDNKRCFIPWQRSMIMSNGDIVIYNRCIPYLAGNLYQKSFADIWHGEVYRSFRRILRKAGAFPVCSRCCGAV